MKKKLVFLLAGLLNSHVHAQTTPALTAIEESQLESYTALTAGMPEDDSHWQQLQTFARRKINLNTASAAVLKSLHILSPLQLQQLLDYRRQMGALLSVYELQAIPGFDVQVVGRLLPYVQAGKEFEPHYSCSDYFRKGEHSLLLRYGRRLENEQEYQRTDTVAARYLGSPDKVMLRYRYQLTHYMSWGVVMEKDAGEPLFRKGNKQGFDFYSLHMFISQYKCIKALAIGDFTVNMGQGLLNWQSLAFGKGAAVMQVKREAALLKAYASAGEHNFYRGAAVTLQHKQVSGTGFISLRQLDGSITAGTGYHRTESEIAKRGTLSLFTTGGNITLEGVQHKLGVNFIQHLLSAPVQKGEKPYQQFAFAGDRLAGVSADYEVTMKNVHLFGEWAMSNNGRVATINGVLMAAGRHVDIVLLYRNYNKGYHSLYADAWGEFYKPVNEKGIYTALSVTIRSGLKMTAYADHFTFPWLQYRAAAPGRGSDVMFALTYTPDKQTECFIRYNRLVKQENSERTYSFIPPLVSVVRAGWRVQCRMQVTAGLTMKSRVEVNSYNKDGDREQGFMAYQEWVYQVEQVALQLYMRYTRFMTGGSNSSLYSTTAGMLYEYALSRLTGDGQQLQVRMRLKLGKRYTIWCRYESTIYNNKNDMGNSEQISDYKRESGLHFQLQHLF
ncbi:ComEA family DNA-binding protein [Chitinophaga rhizophila]|uniref:Helix-hairpin-helix domain-containing protein n=1 Tax=Chitinophaga rhizophila TaxID=2866212 RepID=A0ABS7GDZ9_9BACT|nr:helix-hairpin-helix domain-containing protein [Chitinophaga rhizophila]MBW8685385.1 helix-hairpin-helix domain-containing protein [Chitinophaga rhizophila]